MADKGRQVKGRLDIITGGMFAGKTSELIRRLALHPGVPIRHVRDTRYSTDVLETHGGQCVLAAVANNANDILRIAEGAKAVYIDEAHFYDADKLAAAVEQIITLHDARVVVAGLQYNSEGDRFAWVSYLADFATTITYMRAECHECSMPAAHQFCVTGKVENGGPDDFLPLCKRHFGERMEASE